MNFANIALGLLSQLPFFILVFLDFSLLRPQEHQKKALSKLWTVGAVGMAALGQICSIISQNQTLLQIFISATGIALLIPFLHRSICVGSWLWQRAGIDYWRGSLAWPRFIAEAAALIGLFMFWSSLFRGTLYGLSALEVRYADVMWFFALVVTEGSRGFIEEAFFRGYVLVKCLGFLPKTKLGHTLGVTVASVVFAAAHANELHPWLRYLQVLPIGIVWSCLVPRYGIPRLALIHALYNIGCLCLLEQ